MRLLRGIGLALALFPTGLAAQLSSKSWTRPALRVTAVEVVPATVGENGTITIRCHLKSEGVKLTSESLVNEIDKAVKAMGGNTLIQLSVDGYLVKGEAQSGSGVVEGSWRVWQMPGSRVPLVGPHTARCRATATGLGTTEQTAEFTVIASTTPRAQVGAAEPGTQAAAPALAANRSCTPSLRVNLVPAPPPGEGTTAQSSYLMLPVQSSSRSGERVVCSYANGALSMSYSFACPQPVRVVEHAWKCAPTATRSP